MPLLSRSYLYLITPPDNIDPDYLIPIIRKTVRAGADIIQFRNKMPSVSTRRIIDVAKMLCNAVRREGGLFIVNDRIDIAWAANADGVHLGQGDLPINAAREIVASKKEMIIGISTHSLEQARQAELEGADYIGFGPIFPTSAKQGHPGIGIDHIPILSKTIKIPYFAIGGITAQNIHKVAGAGAYRVAISGGIFNERDISSKTGLIKSILIECKEREGV